MEKIVGNAAVADPLSAHAFARRLASRCARTNGDCLLNQFEKEIILKPNSVLALAVATFSLSAGAYALDEDAAKALAKKNDCMKCHAIDKDKKGPSYKKISAKLKGKADAEELAIKSMTVASKVKLADGTEEDHKIINTKDAKEIRNLAQWILAR